MGKPGRVREGFILLALLALLGCSAPVVQAPPPPDEDTTTYPARQGPGVPAGCSWEWAPTVLDSVMVCPDVPPPRLP